MMLSVPILRIFMKTTRNTTSSRLCRPDIASLRRPLPRLNIANHFLSFPTFEERAQGSEKAGCGGARLSALSDCSIICGVSIHACLPYFHSSVRAVFSVAWSWTADYCRLASKSSYITQIGFRTFQLCLYKALLDSMVVEITLLRLCHRISNSI